MPDRKVLVFHVGFIGDTVVSIPALRALRRHYGPSADICLLHEDHEKIPVSPTDVLTGLGLVNRFLTYPFRARRGKALVAAIRLWARLVRERFDEVVYLAPSERPAPSVQRDERFFRLAGIAGRIGFATPSKLDEWQRRAHAPDANGRARPEFLRKLDRLEIDGIDVQQERTVVTPAFQLPPTARAEADRWLGDRRRHHDRELVAICPGAKNPANWWPTERFIEIGRRLLSTSRFEVLIVGGPSDRPVAEQMVNDWQDGISAAGELTVLGSAALLKRCRFMIGLDTGMTHLAGALGLGGVAIYGGRDPAGLWDPFGGLHTVVRFPVPCAECRMTTCPLSTHPCMTGVSVETVWEALQPWLAAAATSAAAAGGQQSHA